MFKYLFIALLGAFFLGIGEYFFSKNGLKVEILELIKTYFLIFLIFCCAFFSQRRWISLPVMTLIVLGTGINVVFNQYFGRYLMLYDISMFFHEMEDTTKGFIAGYSIFYKACIWYIVLYVFLILWLNRCCKKNIITKNKSICASIFLILFLIIIFLPSMKGKKFENNIHYSVVRNSLGVYTNYICSLFKIKTSYMGVKYKEYQIKKINGSVNVIFIMGESANFQHMSLYGYERDTTPFLKSLVHSDQFKYYHGVSRGFSTRIGVPLTLNVIQEPDNLEQLLSLQTNLFHLAKKNGYKTFYLSNQKSGVLASLVNSREIDEFHDVFSKKIPQDTQHDTRLIDSLNQFNIINKSKEPFFIVLHQRNHHFAYQDNYPNQYHVYKKSLNENEKLIDTYDNSMRFQDDFIKKLIQMVDNVNHKPILVVYTSDHGELFGEKGLWGHGAPVLNSAGVPMFIYANASAKTWINNTNLPDQCALGNYHLGKFIARALGWDIKNPNESKNFYVNINLPYDEVDGYKKFTLSEVEKELCHHTE